MPTMNLLDAELTRKEGASVLHLSHTDIHLRLSPERQTTITSGAQENGLVFGIRPEHITAASQPNGHNISAHVHLIEPLGAVNILDIRLGNHSETQDPILLRVRTHPTFQVAVGDTIWLGFDETEMHLFDRETEQAVW